ncbi:unnamed protein product, partial [Allacma fusca]
ILTLALYWRTFPWTRVYFGMAIANAVLRPITCIMLYQLFKVRDVDGVGIGGAFADIIGPLGPVQSGAARQGYQNPNEGTPVASSPPETSTSGPRGYQAV